MLFQPGNEKSWKYPPFSATIVEGNNIWTWSRRYEKLHIACFISATNDFINKYGSDFNGQISFIITGDEEKEAINGTIKIMEWTKEK